MERLYSQPTPLRFVPGLLTSSLTLLASLLDALPGLHLLGTLDITLVLGLMGRALLGLPQGTAPGSRFSPCSSLCETAASLPAGERLVLVAAAR